MIFVFAFIMMIILVIIISIIDNRRLVVRKYSLKSDKISKNVRIAFLSDLHDNELGKDNIKLVENVKNANPDIIIVGGDMITAHPGCDTTNAIKLMSKISSLKKPIFYGIGNHEYRMLKYTEDYGDEFEKYENELRKLNISVMKNDNEFLQDYNLDIQGLMLDRVYYRRFEKNIPTSDYLHDTIGKRNLGKFRILLAHNPEFFEKYSLEADLVLSGHVHGGIMRLPLLGGVISTKFTLFPKYDGGKFEMNDSVMIVSRGLGSHTIPIRIFNPVELDLIDIIAER